MLFRFVFSEGFVCFSIYSNTLYISYEEAILILVLLIPLKTERYVFFVKRQSSREKRFKKKRMEGWDEGIQIKANEEMCMITHLRWMSFIGMLNVSISNWSYRRFTFELFFSSSQISQCFFDMTNDETGTNLRTSRVFESNLLFYEILYISNWSSDVIIFFSRLLFCHGDRSFPILFVSANSL